MCSRTDGLWLLWGYNGRTEEGDRFCRAANPQIFILWPLRKHLLTSGLMYCSLELCNHPQIWQLKTTNIYFLTFLWVGELGCLSWGNSGSWSLMRLQASCWPGLQSSEGFLEAEESISKLTPVVVSRPQFLTGCWLGGLGSLTELLQWAVPQDSWLSPEQVMREREREQNGIRTLL